MNELQYLNSLYHIAYKYGLCDLENSNQKIKVRVFLKSEGNPYKMFINRGMQVNNMGQ